jgi:hypothetical protein
MTIQVAQSSAPTQSKDKRDADKSKDRFDHSLSRHNVSGKRAIQECKGAAQLMRGDYYRHFISESNEEFINALPKNPKTDNCSKVMFIYYGAGRAAERKESTLDILNNNIGSLTKDQQRLVSRANKNLSLLNEDPSLYGDLRAAKIQLDAGAKSSNIGLTQIDS